jgi:hypothetical protein
MGNASRHHTSGIGSTWLYRRAGITIALLLGCANPKQEKLERGMAFARRRFMEATRNPIAMMALGSNMEAGGNLTTYLAANMPDSANLPRFQDDRPAEAWSIALRAVGRDTIIIEGYGEKLDRPVKADTVIMRPHHGP